MPPYTELPPIDGWRLTVAEAYILARALGRERLLIHDAHGSHRLVDTREWGLLVSHWCEVRHGCQQPPSGGDVGVELDARRNFSIWLMRLLPSILAGLFAGVAGVAISKWMGWV